MVLKYMKLVYLCRTGFKNGGLRERPSLKMGGFQSSHSWEKWDLGAKNNKHIFLKRVSFSICQGWKTGTKNCMFLKRGLLEWPRSKK